MKQVCASHNRLVYEMDRGLPLTSVFVHEFVCRFGTPLQIVTDQGRNIFVEMCELLHIDKTRTTSQQPQSNGGVEQFNNASHNAH